MRGCFAMNVPADRLGAARCGPGWRAHATGTTLAILVARLTEWRRRARSRAVLARFGARELRDIGFTPADAARECAKPFWRD